MTRPDPIKEVEHGYVTYDNRLYKKEALETLKPDLFLDRSDQEVRFGARFPKFAKKGNIFTRVDVLPNRVFKYDGERWIEINKDQTNSYLDDNYLEYLIEKINSGEVDIDSLTDDERLKISEYLTNK